MSKENTLFGFDPEKGEPALKIPNKLEFYSNYSLTDALELIKSHVRYGIQSKSYPQSIMIVLEIWEKRLMDLYENMKNLDNKKLSVYFYQEDDTGIAKMGFGFTA